MEKQDGYLSTDAAARGSVGPNVELLSTGEVGGVLGGGPGGPTPGASAASLMTTRRPIESLLEIIKEDLNNYGECMIPVDDANTINMKLFPHHPTPPEVKGWHVPVAKMKFADVVDPTWDLTLQRVVAHIDGVSDVRRIALASGVSLELTKLALRHLLYYDTILLLDMFFFGACYAPRPGIHDFVANVGGMVDECANYVCVAPPATSGPGRGDSPKESPPPPATTTSSASRSVSGSSTAIPHHAGASSNNNPHITIIDTNNNTSSSHHGDDDSVLQHMGSSTDSIIGSSASLTGGRIPHQTSHYPHTSHHTTNYPEHHPDQSHPPHKPRYEGSYRVSNYQLIKLMTTFTVGKTVTEWLKGHMDSGFDVLRFVDVRRLVQFGVIKGCLYRVHKHVISKQYLAALATGQARPSGKGDPLQKYTDGCHTFDQIITEKNLTDSEIMEKLKSFPAPAGDLTVLYK